MKYKEIKQKLKALFLVFCITTVCAPCLQAASNRSNVKRYALTAGTSTFGAGLGLVSLVTGGMYFSFLADDAGAGFLIPSGTVAATTGFLSLASFYAAWQFFSNGEE